MFLFRAGDIVPLFSVGQCSQVKEAAAEAGAHHNNTGTDRSKVMRLEALIEMGLNT